MIDVNGREIRRLIREELTKTDKEEIKRMINKEIDKATLTGNYTRRFLLIPESPEN